MRIKKINLKIFFVFCFLFLVIGILVYTRFVNLGWGLPYPFHPDERNMANALQQLNCREFPISPFGKLRAGNFQFPINFSNFKFQISNFSECGNPHFFAYGQFPLYLGRFIVFVMKFFDGDLNTPVGFGEAVISLRIISAVASIINVFIVLKIIKLLLTWTKSKIKILPFAFLLLIFSPYAIQLSHFGTTESLLMLFYSLIIYLSLKLLILDKPISNYYLISIISGLAIATKFSTVVFLTIPLLAILISNLKIKFLKKHLLKNTITIVLRSCFQWLFFLSGVIVFSVLFSPHNLINFQDFLGAIHYESDVALGHYIPFYTRQFVDTTPIIFQMTKIFPYALGWPQFILAILGFFLLPWKNKLINFLRFAILAYFLPNAFLFAKWTRFMAPVLPILTIFSILFIFLFINFITQLKKFSIFNFQFSIKSKFSIFKNLNIKNSIQISNFKLKIGVTILIFIIIIPGIAYLKIYQTPDVRFQASDWIYKNIPKNSYILSETANVVDIPIPSQNIQYPISNIQYKYISFNFYDLDENPALQEELKARLEKADYIFIPSRRIFGNLQSKYPLLNKYYDDLFSGRLGFTEIAKFSSYPKICLFHVSCFMFPDEAAEETWSVFDHPVIRIYKRSPKSEIRNPKQILNSNFQNYKITDYRLLITNYQLLVADTPKKWQQGLMNVRNKQEINGKDGMIFIFSRKERLTFWNKNTYSDLDVYWLDDDKVVGKSYLPSIEKSGKIVTIDSSSEVNRVIEIIR